MSDDAYLMTRKTDLALWKHQYFESLGYGYTPDGYIIPPIHIDVAEIPRLVLPGDRPDEPIEIEMDD